MDDKLLEALKLISEHCKNRNCEECILDEVICNDFANICCPGFWNLEEYEHTK